MITQTLKAASTVINRKRVQRLMRVMGLAEHGAEAPDEHAGAMDHPVYPYLLRGLAIARPNPSCGPRISPTSRWRAASPTGGDHRLVLPPGAAWRLSNTLDTGFCLEALRDRHHALRPADHLCHRPGIAVHGGGLHPSPADREIKISMDGKGRYLDNIFVERLPNRRSLKSEEIYLHPYDSLTEAREGIGRYFRFYNDARPIRRWAIRRRPRSMTRRRGAPPHERACRLGAGCRCARPPPGSPLRSDPAPRGAGGDLTPSPRTGVGPLRVPGPGLQPSSHDTTTTRTDPGRLHLSKARFWSERWGPPHVGMSMRPIVSGARVEPAESENECNGVGGLPQRTASIRIGASNSKEQTP